MFLLERFTVLGLLVILLSGCHFQAYIISKQQSSLTEESPPPDPPPPPMVISSSMVTVINGVGKQSGLPIQISGGTPPFKYYIESGPGSIDEATGIYSQPLKWDTTVVKIVDSAGQIGLVNVVNSPLFVDGGISTMDIDGDNLFIGGGFGSTQPDSNPVFSIWNQSNGVLANMSSAPCNYMGKFELGLNNAPHTLVRNGDYLFIGGNFSTTKYVGVPVANVIKINFRTCQLDTAFNEAAKTLSGTVYALAANSTTNSLYIGGQITAYGGQTVQNILKVNLSSGVLDSVFSQNVGFDNYVTKILEQDSSIFAIGGFGNYRGSPAQGVAKIDKTTGLLDTVFTQATGLVATEICDMLILGSNLFIATRDSGGGTYRGVNVSLLVKVDINSGNLDAVFSQTPSFGFPEKVLSIATDGTDLFVAGEFSSYRGVACPRVIKLDAGTGAMIPAFNWGTGATGGGGFYVYYDNVNDELIIDTGGQAYNGAATKLIIKVDKNTGVINSTFESNFGLAPGNYIQELVFLPDNQFVVVYYGTGAVKSNSKKGLAKINLLTWELDPVFDIGTGFNGTVYKILVYGNYLYVGGNFTTYNGQPAQKLAKIHKDTGVLDTTFTQASGITGGTTTNVYSLATDGTGLYVCGVYTHYRGTATQSFSRVLLSDGTLDTTFTQAAGLGSNFTAVCNDVRYFNNSIYLTGAFVVYRGATALRVAKVHPTTGVLDTTFTQATGIDSFSSGSALFDDGVDLYVSGSMTVYRGTGVRYLIKLNPNSGDLDTTFSQATGANTSLRMLGLFDGRIIASGMSNGLATYRGETVKELIGVNTTDGSLFDLYKSSLGFNSAVSAMKAYNNKLIAVGSFTTFKERSAQQIFMIDPITGLGP